MKRLTYLLICVLLSGMALSLDSCKGAKLKDADEAYERGEYDAASVIYRKIYNKLTNKDDRWLRGEVAYSMGLCYRKLNQSNRAAAAFQNAIRYEVPDSLALLYLAEAEQMDGRYNDAIKHYKAYLEKVPGDPTAMRGIKTCEQAPKWLKAGSRYQVKMDKLFNSRRADFCPMFFDKNADIIYFTSSTEKATGTTKSEITGTKNCDVFFSKLDDKGKWSRPAPVEGELNSEWDEGITTFSPDGMMMYLARAVRKPSSPTGVEIYTSNRSEAKWSAPTKFEITADTLSSYNDPAVSADGKYLYFASDMPGGQGGIDIWRINIKDKHGTLENLGDQINTTGDDRFPYSRNDTVLYFASNGHAGFGGLDIFKATLKPSGRWFIENMGAPINSSADDFGITFGKGESGFFSSNRKDGRGYDHIYSFEKPELKVTIIGNVIDKDDEPVPNAVIRIIGNDGSNQKAAAKPDGTFRFDLDRGVSYVMLAGAPGYLNGTQQFTSDIAEEDAEYAVDFVLAAINKPQVIDNIFYDFDKASLRDVSREALDGMVKMLKDNPLVTIELAAHTDRIGSDKYNQDLSQRRAQSVVDYLVDKGVESERIRPVGYGKSRPKVITKHINKQYPQFEVGDTLTEAYIAKLEKPDKQAADQVNRRTEFMVLTTNFEPFADDLKRMKEEEALRKAAQGDDDEQAGEPTQVKPEEAPKPEAQAADSTVKATAPPAKLEPDNKADKEPAGDKDKAKTPAAKTTEKKSDKATEPEKQRRENENRMRSVRNNYVKEDAKNATKKK